LKLRSIKKEAIRKYLKVVFEGAKTLKYMPKAILQTLGNLKYLYSPLKMPPNSMVTNKVIVIEAINKTVTEPDLRETTTVLN
jgi:hypothetical protein